MALGGVDKLLTARDVKRDRWGNCTRDVSTEDSGKRRGRGWGGGRMRDESSTSLERSVRGVAETKIGNRVWGIIVRVGEGAGGAERYGPHENTKYLHLPVIQGQARRRKFQNTLCYVSNDGEMLLRSPNHEKRANEVEGSKL